MVEATNTPCTICQNTAISLDNRLHLFRCPRCTHTFTQAVRVDPQLYSEDYFYTKHKNWFNNPNYKLFKFFHKILRGLIQKKKISLLDVGCGKGDFLKYIKQLDPDIELYGIDLADNKSQEFHFIKGDLLKEDIPMQFDVVCGNATIEHVDNPQFFMKKLHRILLPNGLLFLSTINNLSLIYRIARILKALMMPAAYNQLYGEHHLQHYTNRSLRHLLESNGFQILIQKNYNYPLNSIDVIKDNPYIKRLYVAGVWLTFFLQSLSKTGIAQIVVCRKMT